MTPVPVLRPRIEGRAGDETLFFIQGWPDDHTVWDTQVALLRDRYRCVRVDLPGHGDAAPRRWGYDHEAVTQALVACIRSTSPGKPVTLIAHDWGSVWAHRIDHEHPGLVSRIVTLDVAPDIRPTPREVLLIIAYQWWLVGAFVAGGRAGDWMTRRLGKLFKSPKQGAQLSSTMNYPYLYTWRDIITGRAAKTFKGYAPQVPILFVYGERKPGRFHSDRWLQTVRGLPGGKVVALPRSGHWVMRDPELNGILKEWLESTAITPRNPA